MRYEYDMSTNLHVIFVSSRLVLNSNELLVLNYQKIRVLAEVERKSLHGSSLPMALCIIQADLNIKKKYFGHKIFPKNPLFEVSKDMCHRHLFKCYAAFRAEAYVAIT